MTTAQQIKRDYKNDLMNMHAEAKAWGDKAEATAWKGNYTYPTYYFSDGSALEFKMFGEIERDAKRIK